MAVLGSQRAYQLLQPHFDFARYQDNLQSLKQQFQDLKEEDWLNTSYTAWLQVLENLVDADYDEQYPDFMKNLVCCY